MGSSVIFNGTKVKTLKSILTLNGLTDIISSATDPTSVAVNAPAGSLLLNTSNSKLYRKLDAGSSTNWVEMLSTASTSVGVLNYIGNPGFESDASGYVAYADAAGVSPLDGTGGSPTVTITRTTSTPLRGAGSGLITKDAANRQGEGVSYDFSIAEADKGNEQYIAFEYTVASGTFVTGTSSDIKMFLYDVTNAALIPMMINTIDTATGSNGKFAGFFKAATNSTSYRLIWHVATTSANAYTLKIDNIVVGPIKENVGSLLTPWRSYGSITSSWGTGNAAYTGYWKRIGDSMSLRITIHCTGTQSGQLTLSAAQLFGDLTTSPAIDHTRLPRTSDDDFISMGFWTGYDHGTAVYGGEAYYDITDGPFISFFNNTNNVVTATSPFTFNNTDSFGFDIKDLPITGWV